MFLFREPSREQIQDFLAHQGALPFSYPEVGATREESFEVSSRYAVDSYRVRYVDREEEHRYGFAYGTLPGHAERGEERFGILRDRRDNSVYYEVLAFSRPNHPLSHAGYPVARTLQRRFALDSKQAMVAAVEMG